jgi:hypothetical protein
MSIISLRKAHIGLKSLFNPLAIRSEKNRELLVSSEAAWVILVYLNRLHQKIPRHAHDHYLRNAFQLGQVLRALHSEQIELVHLLA